MSSDGLGEEKSITVAEKIILGWEMLKAMLTAQEDGAHNEFNIARTMFNKVMADLDRHKFRAENKDCDFFWHKYYNELKTWQEKDYVVDIRLNKKVGRKLVKNTISFLSNQLNGY